MGCNTSSDTTVVDTTEKPEERPKTAASTKETPAEETNGTANKDTENDKKQTVPAECHQVRNMTKYKLFFFY